VIDGGGGGGGGGGDTETAATVVPAPALSDRDAVLVIVKLLIVIGINFSGLATNRCGGVSAQWETAIGLSIYGFRNTLISMCHQNSNTYLAIMVFMDGLLTAKDVLLDVSKVRSRS
jgi:hypothetical protein